MKIGKFSRKRSQWGNSPRNQKICSEIGGKSETEGGNASLPQGGWTPLSSKISHVSPVSDSRGEANPDMTLIQFGYRFWSPSKEEINTRYWETYQIGPNRMSALMCMVNPSRESGSPRSVGQPLKKN